MHFCISLRYGVLDFLRDLLYAAWPATPELDSRSSIKTKRVTLPVFWESHTVEQSIIRRSFQRPSLLSTLIQQYLHSLDLAS